MRFSGKEIIINAEVAKAKVVGAYLLLKKVTLTNIEEMAWIEVTATATNRGLEKGFTGLS